MKRVVLMLMAACLLLSGCANWFTGNYISVTPHKEQPVQNDTEEITVSRYAQLRSALANLIEDGTEKAIIYVTDYDASRLETDLNKAVDSVLTGEPIAAYAVEKIDYELGTNSGKAAVALNIAYLHGRYELRRMQRFSAVQDAISTITGALDSFDTGVVFLIRQYTDTDFAQIVENYAEQNPHIIMEVPAVSVNIYPETGSTRVVELKYTYQTSREALRTMQTQVQPVFASAALYVSGARENHEKLAQLYSFLIGRYEYKIETSITPAYSLLRHGVGDSKAFAQVYAAMCRRAGIECYLVSGTRTGEAWYWNIVKDGDFYYHVDLLSGDSGEFRELADDEMAGYVWDYSAYPACGEIEQQTTTTTEQEKNNG